MSKLAWLLKPEFLMGERDDDNLCSSVLAVTENQPLPQMIVKLSSQKETLGSVMITSASEEKVVTSSVRSEIQVNSRISKSNPSSTEVTNTV